MKKRFCRITAAALAALVTAVSLAGCQSKKKEEEVHLTRVETQKAERGRLELTSTYVGTMSPYTAVNVTPLVSGTVKSVAVRVGDRVEAGDVLCEFDDKAARLQLQSAEDAVESARAGKKAAKDQISAAKKQAQVSITSLEGQRSTLKQQRDSARDQRDELKKNLDALKKAQEAADQAYAVSRSVYDQTNSILIRYQSFLAANPDCLTTAGLMAASIPQAVTTEVSGGGRENAGNGLVFSAPDFKKDDDLGPSGSGTSKGDSHKQQTAAALLKLLGEVPITVEYVSVQGIAALRDQAEQARALSASAASGYAQAESSILTLDSNIEALDLQIKALDDNIRAAKDAADTGGGTEVYDAQIRAAETGVESAQYQKDLYIVTAPINGIIESVNVTENQLFPTGQPAFSISDKEIMTVTFYVPETVRDHLSYEDEVVLEPGKRDLKGRVSSIATALDPQKGLFEIKADIGSVTDRSLLSNTSVSLSLVSDSVENEILIPFDAVYYDNDQAYVFVISRGADGTSAVRRDVTAGLYSEDKIAITEGLSQGDEVVTSWGAGLKDGALVEVVQK